MSSQSLERRGGGGGYLSRPAPSGLADVIEIILDKGLVIDAYVRVSLVGIELLTIDARIVIDARGRGGGAATLRLPHALGQ